MTPEFTVLGLAALLQVGQIVAYSIAGNMQIDTKTAFGPRDTPVHLEGMAGRLQRALNNHFEALILFTIACLIVSLSGHSSSFTTACAWIYLGARITYVPAYALGLSPWRSIIWFVGFAATAVMLIVGLL